MKKRLAWVGIPVAALVIAASVFLLDRSAPPPDGGEDTHAQQIEAGRPPPDAPASPADGSAASAAEAEMAIRSTETTGDMTMSHLRGGSELGYVDVDSIINNYDPYSIVAILQAHRSLTGADESLEIEIRHAIDYPASTRVAFDQLIGGKRSADGRGSISFEPATGTVKSIIASLVTPDPALAGSVAILQDEAVAIAREAVTSAVLQEETVAIVRDGDTLRLQPRLRPGFAFQISRVTPKEFRYALDPETNKVRAEWPVWIGARGVAGGLSWEVLVDASTGEIAGINDLVRRNSGVCSDLTFLVCDGSMISEEDDECGDRLFDKAKPFPDNHRIAVSVIGDAKGMTADIKAANSSYIGSARGTDCTVEIVADVRSSVMGTAPGMYFPDQDRILLRRGAGRSTIAHEVMHALSKTPSEDVEHGLVDAAEALHMGGGWSYGDEDFTTKPEDMSSDMHAGVAHAIYRISQKVGEDMAFKIVLGTDLEEPNSGNAYSVISEVAGDLDVGTEVDKVLDDLGVGPLSRAKEEYQKKLKAALKQLSNAERSEITAQHQEAAKKIRKAQSRWEAQQAWEWIKGIIERMIGDREDDDVMMQGA